MLRLYWFHQIVCLEAIIKMEIDLALLSRTYLLRLARGAARNLHGLCAAIAGDKSPGYVAAPDQSG